LRVSTAESRAHGARLRDFPSRSVYSTAIETHEGEPLVLGTRNPNLVTQSSMFCEKPNSAVLLTPLAFLRSVRLTRNRPPLRVRA
jgi:hypothetical protein